MVKSSRRVDADRAGEKMSFTVRVKEELLSLKRFEKRNWLPLSRCLGASEYQWAV